MSRKANNQDKRTYIRCPWCGRQPIQVKRGNLVSHLSPGGVKCIAIGMRIAGSMFDPRRHA